MALPVTLIGSGRSSLLQFEHEPEDREAFKTRIQAVTDRYEAQFLPRRERKLSTKQIREMDAGVRLLPSQ